MSRNTGQTDAPMSNMQSGIIQPFATTAALNQLAAAYASAGHELWLVGGCVRDHVLGQPCKDVDLATSATPDEQVALCEATGRRWFGTGLSHGTLTVMAGDEPYEITTFRADVETDGRHAVVEYVRDLQDDLARRDLTMNAIAMDFEGRVVDPHGGVADALAGRVRFVGDADRRIAEDYLRIMRWLRFTGRFGQAADEAAVEAVRRGASGLRRISVERIWSETARILAGPDPERVVRLMAQTGVMDELDLPPGDADRLARMRGQTRAPATLLAAWLGNAAEEVMARWKASTADREAAGFATRRLAGDYRLADAKLDVVDGQDGAVVEALLRVNGRDEDAAALAAWTPRAFPVAGRDLVAAGYPAGPQMGDMLRNLRTRWIQSDFMLERDELLDAVAAPAATG